MGRANDDGADEQVDEQAAQSFPASDPPATSQPGDDPVVTTTSDQPAAPRSTPNEADAR